MHKKRIIALDVDEVCANLLEAWLWVYNQKYNDSVRVEDVTDWGITKYATKCTTNQFYDILRKPYCGKEFYEYVQPIQGSWLELQELRKLGRVVFLSSCAKDTCDQKRRWLERNGFLKNDKDLVLASDKSLIRADVLLDDAVHNVERFPGHAFLVSHTHNLGTPCFRERLPGPGLYGAAERIERLFSSM